MVELLEFLFGGHIDMSYMWDGTLDPTEHNEESITKNEENSLTL